MDKSALKGVIVLDPSREQLDTAPREAVKQAYILTSPEPLQVAVDSPTDWYAAVVTPVVVGLAAAYIAWLNQRNSIRSAEALQKIQLRSSIANFRQIWSTDFRAFVAEFVGCASLLHFKKCEDIEYPHSPEADEVLTKMVAAQASIKMMLDAEKDYFKEISDLMNDINIAVFDAHPTHPKPVLPLVHEFVEKAQKVRERAWNDIKRDLNHR